LYKISEGKGKRVAIKERNKEFEEARRRDSLLTIIVFPPDNRR
jgi:hypothetical protein